MRCAICDADDDIVTHVQKDCKVCQAIINEIIQGYEDVEPPEDDQMLEEYPESGC